MKTKTKYKLPKQIKDRWISALRSGEYEQGKMSLYDKADNNFCCLGVLGKICKFKLDQLEDESFLYNLEEKPKGCSLPFFFRDKEVSADLQSKLAGFNDSGKSFNWIASYIERYL